MRLQQTQIWIFERYSLTLPETLVCHQDGLPGRRSVFITDREESFLVTFEEGMSQMDLFSLLMEEKTAKAIGFCGSKFIFQRRATPKSLYTLPASMGMGGGYVPMVYENHGIDSRYTGPLEIAPTMSARYGTGGNNVPLVEHAPHTFCIVGNIIDRQPENGGNGMGC